MNKKINMEAIKKFANEQHNKYLNGELSEENVISFEYEGMNITNPFFDCDGRFEVDPIKYYGDDFLNSKFININ